MSQKGWKNLMITIFAMTTAWLGNLAMPVYVLMLLNLVDYATGLIAAPYRGEMRNSYKSVRGIAKKVCTLLLIGLAAIVDWLLLYTADFVGVPTHFSRVLACLTAVWLICNELISILENIGDIGVALPPFLKKAVEWLRQSAEKKGDLQ